MKNFIKITVSVLLLISCIVMFTGCWDKRELNELAIVLGVGVDKSDDGQIMLTAQIAKSSSNQGGSSGGYTENEYTNIKHKGEYILDTLRRMTTQSSRQMYNSHNQVIVIEKDLAQDGIYDYIDFFARDNEFRYTMWLVISEGKASDILDAKTQYDNVPTTELSQLIDMQRINCLNVQTTVLDFVKTMSRDNGAVLLPMVHLESNDENSGKGQSGVQSDSESGESEEIGKKEQGGKGENGGQSSNGDKFMKISKAAVMKDSKMVGEITEQEIRGYLWCVDKVDSTILAVECDDCSGNVEIFRSKCGYDVKLNDDGSISVKVSVKAEGMLHQLKGGYNKPGEELLRKMEKACCGLIESEIEKAFEASKEYNADFMGICTQLDRYSQKEWGKFKKTEQGKNYLQNIKLETEIDVVIEGTGALNIGEDIIS